MARLIITIFTILILNHYQVEAPDSLVVNQNSVINTKYSSIISRNSVHIYQFSIPSNVSNYAVQTEVFPSNLSGSNQIFGYTEHEIYVESWQIPFKHQLYDSVISSRSIYACRPQLTESQNISIRLQTFSSQQIPFSLRVASIQSNILELSTEATTSISLASPRFFVHDFPENIQFLEFQLSSPSELCALVRFTSYSCPPDFTLRASRGSSGFDLTMLRLANIRIRRSDFAGSRIMILLIPVPAAQCETTMEYSVNATSENFEKNITLLSKPGNPGFWAPILITLVIFVIPYIMFAIIIGFDLIFGYFCPKSKKHLAIFTSARLNEDKRTLSQVDNDNTVHDPNIELGEVSKGDQINQAGTDVAYERIESENPNTMEAHKYGVMNGDLSSEEKNSYYYNLINSKNIKVSDLNFTPDPETQKIVAIYPYTVMIIGLFYFLPALQVSYINYEQLLATGSLDICYINYRCARNAGELRSFNSIWSNIGYLLLSILFFVIVYIKQIIFTSEVKAQGRPTRGIPQTFSLYYAVALALFFESILSSIYHICPSMSNFQFDSTFQYVFLVLLAVRMYQNRHPDTTLKPSHVFYLLSICVIFTSLSLLGENSYYPPRIILTLGFAIITGILLYLVYNLYLPKLAFSYYRDWKENRGTAKTLQQIFCPKYNRTRLFQMIGLIAAVGMIIIVIWTPGILTTIATGILLGITLNIMFYYLYYWIMKLVHKEFLHRPFVFTFALALLITSSICWGFGFYFWYTLRGSWSLSPALARERLTDCIFLDYFDDHDMWHIMSSFGIFTLYLSTLLVDENLSLVPQEKISVF